MQQLHKVIVPSALCLISDVIIFKVPNFKVKGRQGFDKCRYIHAYIRYTFHRLKLIQRYIRICSKAWMTKYTIHECYEYFTCNVKSYIFRAVRYHHQGSILGPLLFLIYTECGRKTWRFYMLFHLKTDFSAASCINDLPKITDNDAKVVLFSDATRIIRAWIFYILLYNHIIIL
jgi:hypothetical protein